MARLLIATLSLCLLSFGFAHPAQAAKRVAFVVGIDAYDNLPDQLQLRKAVNDANAMSETLTALGYDVQKADNVTRLDFVRQWQLFLNRLEPGDEAAIYFAGHGVEIGGQNFLLPRDVPRVASGEEEVLKASGLPLSGLLEQVRERKPQVSLYILDACRDNPFVDGKGRGIGATRGLARVEPPSGTFIMFSAGAAETALDRLSDNDPSPNSVYTRTLLPRLKASGKITDIARDVRREVRELAASVAHVQTPAYYDEVVGDFCPAGCEAKAVATILPEPTPAPPAEAESAEVSPPAPPLEPPPVETAVAAVEPSDAGTRSSANQEGALLRSFGPMEHAVVSVSFAPDGQNLYALVSGGYFMHLDPASGDIGKELGLVDQRPCCQLTVSPDGRYLASGNYDNLVKLWDAESGEPVRSFKGHSDFVVAVAFSPDGKQLVSGSYDGTVRLWNAGSGKQLRVLDPRVGKIYAVALSPDGTRLASGHGDGDIKVWDLASGRLLRSMKSDNYGVYSLVFSPDGSRVYSAGANAKVKMWDAATGKELKDFGEGYNSLCCVAISPDGATVASGGADNLVRLWDVASGALLGKFVHADWLQSVAFSPDGATLASASNDKTVKLWELRGNEAAAR